MRSLTAAQAQERLRGTVRTRISGRTGAVASCGVAALFPVWDNFGYGHAHGRLAKKGHSSTTSLFLNTAALVANMNEADKISTASSCCQWPNFPFLFDDSTLDCPRASFVVHFPSPVRTNMDSPETPQRELGLHYHSMPFLERAPASDPPSDPPLKARSLCMTPYCSQPGHMLMVVSSTRMVAVFYAPQARCTHFRQPRRQYQDLAVPRLGR